MPLNFVGLEAGATAMLSWEPTLIPGLLQTQGYMRSLMRAVLPSEPPEDLERRIALRLTRQRRLTGHQPIELHVVIDESVLHRVIGGVELMTGQLRRIREVAAGLTNVTVQVLPFSAGAHQLLGGPAAILEFSGTADPDVLFMEGFCAGYQDRPSAVERFRAAFDGLSERALDERRSIDMIDSMLRGEA
jgi:hypothetical protein